MGSLRCRGVDRCPVSLIMNPNFLLLLAGVPMCASGEWKAGFFLIVVFFITEIIMDVKQ